jgi:hypothetical protein
MIIVVFSDVTAVILFWSNRLEERISLWGKKKKEKRKQPFCFLMIKLAFLRKRKGYIDSQKD